MEQRISLVTLGVTDLARARSFYEAMGWRQAQQPDDEVCFFQAGGMVFGLWTALGGHGAPGIELAHNVRAPAEVAAVLAEAERAGGTVVRAAAHAEWGGVTGAFADPDGYVWEVAHNPGWTIAAGRLDSYLIAGTGRCSRPTDKPRSGTEICACRPLSSPMWWRVPPARVN